MTVQNILDSIYIIPVILDHLDKPTDLTEKILEEHGIWPETVGECRKIRHLLEYHRNTIRDDYKANYELLRTGLKEYFQEYLAHLFMEARLPLAAEILDYGAGTGYMAERIRRDYPLSKVYTLDRIHADITVDFEREPNWWRNYREKFHVVIMSELLHCKGNEGQHYLTGSAWRVLQPKGRLIIIENEDYLMAYRISKLKGDTFKVIDGRRVRQLTEHQFQLTNQITVGKHTLYDLTKI